MSHFLTLLIPFSCCYTGQDIRECISECASSGIDSSDRFESQSLVTFFENDEEKFIKCKSDKKYLPMFRRINKCLSVERNLNGQIYLTHSLHLAGHFTSNTQYLKQNLFGKSFSLSSDEVTPSDENMQFKFPYCHVPSGMNYVSDCGRELVINVDQEDYADLGLETDVSFPLTQCTRLVSSMFRKGLHEFFKFDSKKRRSSSSNVSIVLYIFNFLLCFTYYLF